MRLAEGVVQRGVEGATGHERGQLGNRLRQPQLAAPLVRDGEELFFHRDAEVHRMAKLSVAFANARAEFGQRRHGVKRLVVIYHARRERPELESGIEPKPWAVWPPRVMMSHSTFSTVALSSATPPNLMGVR
jgi:hypothetical protein